MASSTSPSLSPSFSESPSPSPPPVVPPPAQPVKTPKLVLRIDNGLELVDLYYGDLNDQVEP